MKVFLTSSFICIEGKELVTHRCPRNAGNLARTDLASIFRSLMRMAIERRKRTNETKEQKFHVPRASPSIVHVGRNLVSLSSWEKVRVEPLKCSHMFNPSLAPLSMALCNEMLETDLMEKVQL
jgi:hypothetical protein